MKKRMAIRNFVLIGIVIVIGIVLTVCSFTIPFTVHNFKGFAKGIQLGLDLKGGVMAVYDAKESDDSEGDFDSQLDATINRITVLISEKYPESTIVKQGTNQIRIEVPDVSDPDEVLELIGEPAVLEFKKEENGEALLTGKDIKNASAQYDSSKSEWGVSLEFTTSGAAKFQSLTAELAPDKKPLYIYIGGKLFSSPTVNEEIAGGKTFISGGMKTESAAKAYATRILSGTYSVTLSLSEKSVISATLGENALLLGIIAGAIGLAFIMVFMVLIYKHLGIIADVALVIYTIVLMAALSLIPGIQLTLPGIAGIVLGLGMAVDGNVIIFERIKDEFRSGKKIPASVKFGFKRATVAVLDSNITTIIAACVLWWLGTGAIAGFAKTLLVSIVVSMFTTLVVTRGLINNYLPLNSTNHKKLGLKKGVALNEETVKEQAK